MIPSLCLQSNRASVFIDKITSIVFVGNVSDNSHVRVSFNFFVIGLLDSKEQFVIFTAI